MIDSIKREGTKVILHVLTDLLVKESVLVFSWDCRDEIFAELLRKHLDKNYCKHHERIAKNCLDYLEATDITKLKAKLKQWDARPNKQCWK